MTKPIVFLHGVKIDIDRIHDCYELTATAPNGYIFDATGTHTLHGVSENCNADVLTEDLSYGISMCEDPECDCCESEGPKTLINCLSEMDPDYSQVYQDSLMEQGVDVLAALSNNCMHSGR